MSNIDTENKEPRFMKITASLRCDKGMTESCILAAFKALENITVGSAYILHDRDTYTVAEVAELQKRYDDAISDGSKAEDLEPVPNIGDSKPPHYHILLAFKNQTRLSTICKAFHLDSSKDGHLICKVYNTKDYINLLAYLTHITPRAQADGKYEYAPEDIKGLILPEFKGRVILNACKTYKDFRDAFLGKELENDDILRQVAYGKMTIKEVIQKDRMYYIDNETKLRRARSAYLSTLKPPQMLFNFYIGVAEGCEDGAKGGIGKTVACWMLAVSLLQGMYPDIDFSEMDSNDLQDRGYVYLAGGEGVALQDYDGEPIILWDDYRAYDFIKTFKTASNFFRSFDIHPNGDKVSIKYGETRMINAYNIINGAVPYSSFISDLSKQYKDGEWVEEDESQARRRMPIFFSLTPDYVNIDMQLSYFFNDIPNKQYRVKNSFKEVASHNKPYRKKNIDAVNAPLIEEKQKLEDRYKKTKDEEPPEGLFEVINPLMTEDEKRTEEARRQEEGRKRLKEMEETGKVVEVDFAEEFRRMCGDDELPFK